GPSPLPQFHWFRAEGMAMTSKCFAAFSLLALLVLFFSGLGNVAQEDKKAENPVPYNVEAKAKALLAELDREQDLATEKLKQAALNLMTKNELLEQEQRAFLARYRAQKAEIQKQLQSVDAELRDVQARIEQKRIYILKVMPAPEKQP